MIKCFCGNMITHKNLMNHNRCIEEAKNKIKLNTESLDKLMREDPAYCKHILNDDFESTY